ncbi:hypothetical protein JRO89_XS01G0264900 [Xanthoceras sorbifolium]|uniref:Phytocyanin domain-containing protein n=1 Tax=Xanthoceras sorbifolium TaxID=99658 RepID=A0ABQ8ILH3_9ROSI|nr:hypothetical protein JRO89_XS01G0264900 [Xanthoceras sorbifolium]
MAMAAMYTVGDAVGWTIMGGVDYRKWADHKDFYVGDTLVFKYSNQYHNVKQVSQKDFLSCNTTSPIATYMTGSDFITLKRTSHYYLLCGFPGHCEAGQKFEILVTPTSLRRTPSTVLSPSPSPSDDETSTITFTSTAPPLYSSNFFLAFKFLVFYLVLTGFFF